MLQTLTIWFSLDHQRNRRNSHKQSWKKWKRSDSADSDSVALMTPIFDFHQVISALMTPLTRTPTPSIVGAFHLGKKPGNFGGSKSGISDW